MEKLSQIQKLDALLKLFRTEETGVSIFSIKQMMKAKGIELSDPEVNRYLSQLLSDKYIMWNEDGYLLKLEGLFCEIYEQKIINDTQNKKRIIQNERLLIRGTWFAGIAAILLLLWQIFLYFYPVHADYSYWIWETVKQ